MFIINMVIIMIIPSLMRAEVEPPECPVIETQHRDSSFQGIIAVAVLIIIAIIIIININIIIIIIMI